MTIFTIHGIVDTWEKGKQIFRSYIGRNEYRDFLLRRNAPFQKWRGMLTEQDVLTIDDSTIAGAEACGLAKEFGHEVIFFINPKQIINSEIYWFSILNTLIDSSNVKSILFQNEKFRLDSFREVKFFRKYVKEILCKETSTSINLIFNELSTKLKVKNDIPHPNHVQAITIDELKELKKMNVCIESHGWNHDEIKYMTDEEICSDILQTRNWIKETLNVNSSLYAVPFGSTDLSEEVRSKINGDYFLATDELPLGQIHNNCWNRLDITAQLQTK